MRRLIIFVVIALIAFAGAGFAQEAGSRAEEESRQQQQKARNLARYKPGFVERQILAMERAGGFSVPHGLFVTFADVKRGSGLALGPAYGKVLSSGTTVIGKAVWSIHNYKMAQLFAQSRPVLSDRLVLSGRGRWQDAPGGWLFPLGSDSPRVRTRYPETKTEVSARALFKPVPLLHFAGGLGYERYTTGASQSTDPRLALSAVPGLGADPSYVHSEGSAAIDSRAGEGYSRHGTLLRATFHDYREQNGSTFTFQRTDGDAEQYVPILHGNWVVFLALHASTTTTASGHSVPFFLMPDLGGRDLRGFTNYRFRDRHSIVMTAEYRWYAQEFLEAAIFYDAGKVVPERSALDFTQLKHSYGAGIRLHGPQTTAVRIEVARSSERTRFIVAFSAVGQ